MPDCHGFVHAVMRKQPVWLLGLHGCREGQVHGSHDH